MNGQAARISVRVIPRARRNELAGLRDGALVVRLQAPPVAGAANKALAKFLAQILQVRAGDVQVVVGEHARDKVIQIAGLGQEEAMKRLGL